MSKSIIEKLGITPGPWVATKDDNIRCNDKYVHPFQDGSRTSIAMVWDDDMLKVGSKTSHISLLCAAPEMLEALISVCILFETFRHKKDMETLLPVIQKATGKSWEEIKELLG